MALGTMAIPSAADLLKHGLTDVVFDDSLDTLDGILSRDREERLTGTALLQPNPDYPLIIEIGTKGKQKAKDEWPRRVCFRLALRSNPAAMAHFRRNAQIVTAFFKDPVVPTEPLDGVADGYTSALAASTSSAPFSPARLQLMSRENSRTPRGKRSPAPPKPTAQRKHPLSFSAIAWWEDEHGLWYIGEQEDGRSTDLVEYWHRLTATDGPPSRNFASSVADSDSRSVSPLPRSTSGASTPNRLMKQEDREAMLVYGSASNVLIQIAECLQALEQRQLQLAVCRPEYFRVFKDDTDSNKDQVVLCSANAAVQLPSFSFAGLDASDSNHDLPPSFRHESVIAASVSSAILSHDALFEEALLRKHLRYLAPESVTGRRLSPVGDIFSFGVLAYELVTGRTTDGCPTSPGQIDVLTDIHRHVTAETVSPWDLFHQQSAFSQADDLPNTVTPPKELSDIIMRCLATDVGNRYASWTSVLYDLRKFRQICTSRNGDLTKFEAGAVDRLSRFSLPQTLIEREREGEALDQVYKSMEEAKAKRKSHKNEDAASEVQSNSVKVVTLYGLSGSGKSLLAQRWAATKEAQCLTAWAKLDQHLSKPLSSWVQAFHSLLDRIFSDPSQDPIKWRNHLQSALGPTHMALFLSIISSEWRRAIAPDSDVQRVDAIDWENFLPAFRVFSAKLIRAFIEESRKPLLLVIDDAQWLDKDERALWQDLLDNCSNNQLHDIMVISVFRVETFEPPSLAMTLSSRATVIGVRKFGENGVASFLSQCLHWSSEELHDNDLVAFLYDQTEGNPFYLRSLVSSLVHDGVINFDFETLRWRFDVGLLQDHASEGVDNYLGRVLNRLPAETKGLLALLACLPSIGLQVDMFAQLADMSSREVTRLLQDACQTTNSVTISKTGIVRFSHDRQQAAAYNLLPTDKRCEIHWKISQFLRHSEHFENFVFDAADNAILACDLGTQLDEPAEFASLMCAAARRAATSAAFSTASMYLTRAEAVLDFDLPSTWGSYRAVCFTFAELYAEIAAVLGPSEGSVARVRSVIGFAANDIERATLTTLLVRLLISSGRPADAAVATLDFLESLGYQLSAPVVQDIPQTPDEVELLRSQLATPTLSAARDPLKEKVIALISYCGPSLFITQQEQTRAAVFSIGMSLLASSLAELRECEAASYILGVYAIGLNDVALKIGFTTLAMDLYAKYPTSYFAAGTLVTCSVQYHAWTSFDAIDSTLALEATSVAANWDIATYVLAIDYANTMFSTATFSSRADRIKLWRDSRIDSVTPYSKILVDLHLQAFETLVTPTSSAEPWAMDGAFVNRSSDLPSIEGILLHSNIWHIMQFRLAMLYDAPEDVLRPLMAAALKSEDVTCGLIYGVEWRFYQALFFLQYGTKDEQPRLKENLAFLRRYTFSKDCRMRVEILDVIGDLGQENSSLDDLTRADRVLDLLNHDGFHLLSAILSTWIADWIMKRFGGSSRLAWGYLIGAHLSLVDAETTGPSARLRQKFPSVFKGTPEPIKPLSPSRLFGMHNVPMRPTKALLLLKHSQHSVTSDITASLSTSGTTVTDDQLTSNTPATTMEDNLDNLTFMRSSLVIAAERNPDVLVCTLLRILCQYVRADFAAIALSNDPTAGILRLRGAGSLKILPYDLETNTDAAARLAPVRTMLHVARTGKAITSMSSLRKLRPDPFFTEERMPRSIIVLPLNDQGVVLLSSKHDITAPAQMAHLVTSLATFAAIAMTNSALLSNLERLVGERTRDLTNALQAKTVFMSHITHELRSPLHSVLGLAAVLEDSPGLSSVQKEHLQTIRTSGEDLQTIISNILDISKLESGSVEAESIPFSLRDVVESSLDTVATMAQRKGIEVCLLNATPSDPDVPIVGDPFRIKQVLLNLLSNAVKFTSEGHVTVRWDTEAGRSLEHLKVSLTVEDTGIGILPQKMDRLFHSFSQIDSSITRSYGGSGLGLVISRSLARLLGGDCTATSEYGVGSKFTFTFEAELEKSAKVGFPTSPVKQSSFVLCADGPWRGMLQGNLQAFNCDPVTFNDTMPNALLQDFPNGLSGQTRFDFIFLDTDLISKEDIKGVKRLQSGAKIFYMVKAMKISDVMRDLDIEHSEILSLPLKARSLCNAVIADRDAASKTNLPLSKGGSRINRELANTHPLKILLVDDSNVNLLVGRKILERFGYKDVDTASDGQQAVEAAESTRYDLILMDLQMPVLDGVSANKRIRDSPLSGQPAVVALTANTDEGTREMCTNAGFASYLSKPLSIPLLERCLIKTAEQRSIAGFSPHEAQATNGDADCNGKDAEPNKTEAPGEQGQNGQKGDREMIGEST